MNDFAGKSVWIIGASSGIGSALAEELHSRGAGLILSGRRIDKLQELARRLGTRTIVEPVNVRDAEGLKAAFAHIEQNTIIDSVVFLAGIYQPMDIRNLNLAETEAIIATNLMGAISTIHAVLPEFVVRRKGQIALCASIAGYCGLPHAQPYGATKAALINFAESLRAECFGTGVDIKVINPGFVKTPMTDKNKFPMPMMIDASEAACAISNGLLKKSFEIHFPKKFTYLIKLLRFVPSFLYFRIVSKL